MRVPYSPRTSAADHAVAHMEGHGLVTFAGNNAGGGLGSWLRGIAKRAAPYAVAAVRAAAKTEGSVADRAKAALHGAVKHHMSQ